MRPAGRVLIALPVLAALAAAGVFAADDPWLSSANPAVHERAGMALSRSGQRPQQAIAELSEAIALRPVSAYAWAAYAEARYRAGITDATFESALRRAVELGPYEPDVEEAVALYGLAVWDEVSPPTRAAVDHAVAAGMRRAPEAMLRIADRRGRLAIACRHVAPASAISTPTNSACKRTEAR